MLLVVGALCKAEDAAGLFREAQKAERAGDRFHAYLLYSQAAALDPSNAKLQERVSALAAAAAYSAANQETAPSAAEAQLADGDLSPAEISTLPEALPPPRLKPSHVRAKFDIRGTAQDIAARVAEAYGVTLEVESDYQAPPDFLFRTGELGRDEAFRALEAAANSLIIPLDDHTVLLTRDVPQRRADSEPVMSLAIPIPERIAAQDAQEIVTAVQQTLEIRRIQADPVKRMVYLRDVVAKAIAARQLFFDLCRVRGQVAVEVELVSIDKNSSLSIGLNLPASSQIVNFGNWFHNAPSIGSFTNFAAFGAGKTLFGIGIADAAALATLQRSSTQTLLHAEIVTLDGQTGSLNVGDRYPIVTNTFGGASSAGTTFVPAPTVNFVDLGLTLKVTPSMHESGEITLDVEAGFNVLGATSIDNIPTIGQRKYTGKVRLASGQWAVIAGLIEDSRSATSSGVAGLARIPLLGRLFRQDVDSKDHSELMIILKPRVVDLPPWEFATRTLWVGTEGKFLDVY
ncbi:MAG TPA: type II and III secretion system protein [Bryobacteraceae bacterium]|nr:type II and III secretion system protein [Bryobacteraceae bacterium]